VRVIAAPELTLLQGKTFKTDERFEVENVDGTWVDLSDRLLAADITDDVDQKTVTVVFTLARDSGDSNGASLSPLMAGSTLNVDDSDVYAPLITAGRKFRFSVCCVALTASFASGTYHELVTGRFDKPSFAATQMTVEARDLGGLLIDTIAITDTTYGDEDDPGTALGVGQQYLDDNVGEDAPTLVDESGTDFVVTAFRQVNVPVMEGLNSLATKAGGLVVRYKYDAAGVSQLTMFDPLRDNTTPAVTLTPSRYIEIPLAAIDQTNIRNIIRGEYIDPVTGELSRITPDPTDTDSVAAFGPRFMQIGSEMFEGLTGNQVLDVLNAALADLAFPKFDHEVTRLGFWPVEIGDVIEWAPNGTTYDETQTLAVVGYTHRFERGTFRTTFRCRGTPAGSYADWIRRQGTGPTGPQIPPAPELLFWLGEQTQFGGTLDTVDGAVWLGYRMPAGVDEIRVHVLQGMSNTVGVPNVDGTTLALTIRRPEGNIGKGQQFAPNRYGQQPGEYVSMAVLSTDPNLYKRGLFQGVKAGLTSVPVITDAVQAVDPSGNIQDGTIGSLDVVRDGGSFTVTVTPSFVDPTQGSWLCLVRNEHILPMTYIGQSLDPVVYVDDGLPSDDSYKPVYDAFIWTGGVSGPLFRADPVAAGLTPPAFTLGTPVAAISAGEKKVQISWTGTTAGATGVRVEATLDKQLVRVVDSGALASGTVYDTVLTPKFYRLVAFDGSTDLAWSEWVFYATIQGPLSNPLAVPVFANNTPKPKLAGTGFTDQLRLSVQWKCATPGAAVIAVMRSTAGAGGPFSIVIGSPSADVSAGEWVSPTSAYATTDAWYKLEARAADLTTVLASSLVTAYDAP
jgi:hypothetical protein